jgi:hypothetical protein
MRRRLTFSFVASLVAVLMLAAPALAGGWAVITLDTLPRDVRAGQSMRVGFSIRQHGSELVNTDWEGRALKPVLTARKQADTNGAAGTLVLVAAHSSAQAKGEMIRAEARQEGSKGHFVVDVVFPSEGTWAWEIAAPPFVIQGKGPGDAAVFEPLVVAPAVAAPAQSEAQAAPAQLVPPATVAQPVEAAPTFLGVSPATLRWGGVALLIIAAIVGLAAQRGGLLRRRAVHSQ